MTINITFAETSGGDSLSDTVDMEAVTPGDDSEEQEVFIRHDALVNPITDCAFYITRYTGSSYEGEDADADLIEVLGWGDAATGGFKICQNSIWTTFKNGVGDLDNQIELIKEAITLGTPPDEDGEIPVGGEAYVKFKFSIPTTGSSSGYRAISLVMAYSATS